VSASHRATPEVHEYRRGHRCEFVALEGDSYHVKEATPRAVSK
jgi:hypothetical protein